MTPAPRKSYGKTCKYGTCTNYSKKPGLEKVRFIPFPKPRNAISIARAKKWISACRRDIKLEDIKKHYYVCSQHFVDPNGPTELNPDPIPASSSNVDTVKPKRLNTDKLRKQNPPDLTPRKTNKTMVAIEVTSQTVTTPDVDQIQTHETDQADEDEIQNNEICIQQTVLSTPNTQDTIDLTFYRFLQTICAQCPGWSLNFMQNERNCEIRLFSPKYKMTIAVDLIGESCTTKVRICGIVLPLNHALWTENTQNGSKEDVIPLIHSLTNWIPCATIIHNDVITPLTNCALLCELPHAMCNECTLRLTETTNKKEPATANVNNRFLSQTQLQHKLKKLTRSLLAAKGRERRLERKIKINNKDELTDCVDDGLLNALKKHIDDVSDARRLFIEQQIKAASVRKRGMRWHSRLVKFCHQLRQKSPIAYRFLSDNEFFQLPSEPILRRYRAGCRQ